MMIEETGIIRGSRPWAGTRGIAAELLSAGQARAPVPTWFVALVADSSLNAGAVGVRVVFLVEAEDGFGSEAGAGLGFELFADLVDFGGETNEDIRHRVADFFRVADDHALAIAQHDVAGHADDGRIVGNAAQHDRARAHPAVVADGDVAQDFGARTHDYIVPDRRVTLALFLAGAAECYALVERNVIADDGGFADDDGGAVVDEKAMTDLCAGVNLDQGKPARHLRGKSGEEAEALVPEPVIDAVEPQGVQAGIAEQHFEVGSSGRIPLENGADVVANGLEESEHD